MPQTLHHMPETLHLVHPEVSLKFPLKYPFYRRIKILRSQHPPKREKREEKEKRLAEAMSKFDVEN